MNKKHNERDFGIDLFRIILALMVIIIHINAPATGDVYSHVTSLIIKFLVFGTMALVYPAVNCYVIISGYYSYKNNRGFRDVFYSLLKLWTCLEFFSLGGYLILCMCGFSHFNLSTLISRLFPITSGEWWFMSNYFAVMLISPILNGILSDIGKETYQKYFCVVLIVCSILPFFNRYDDVLGLLNGSGLIWFVILYLTGGGIRKFYVSKSSSISTNPQSLVFTYFFLSFVLVFSGFLFNNINILNGYTLARYNSPVVFLQAVFLFLFFIQVKMEVGKRIKNVVTSLSGLSLASYIFHCQPDVEHFIWRNSMPAMYADSLILIPFSCCIIFSIYFVSIIMEFLRRKMMSIFDIENKIINIILIYVFENRQIKRIK